MTTLSVIIISKNAGSLFRACLASVQWANEIIVLDSGSTDVTYSIATEYTPHVFSVDWLGFGVQKNRALAKASSQWVLSLDADEVLSDGLIQEIKQVIQNPQEKTDAFILKRRSFFCSKEIRFGDWRNDKVVRLFRNIPAIQFTTDAIHEKLIGYQHAESLRQPLFHYTVASLSSMLNKLNSYSTLGAQQAYQRQKKTSFVKAICHSFWCFLRGYVFRLGLLDGKEGFLIAFANASGVFYRYVKLIYLYHNRE